MHDYKELASCELMDNEPKKMFKALGYKSMLDREILPAPLGDRKGNRRHPQTVRMPSVQ